jgi:hypothetical protein
MKTASFARSFWITFLPTAAVFLFGLHLVWMHDYHKHKLPPPVSPPVWGKSYVALYDYGANHGNIDYYLFHTGILGFRQRINQADLLLFGTSHVQYGLSAGQLGQKLSAAEGHSVQVFNLALAGSDLGMIDDIVGANKIHDRTAIFDLFALDSPPPGAAPNFMLGALSSHDLEAYIQVGKCWTEFWRDWLLDGLLPNLRIGNPPNSKVIICKRFLKFTVIRDWNNGDVITLWVPSGAVYPKWNLGVRRPIDNTFRPYASLPNGGIGRHPENEILQAHHIHAIYTLIPFDGSDAGVIPADAQPFVPLSTDGLFYWDGTHLTGEGRDAATEKLFEGIEKLGLHIGPPAKP